MERWEIRATPTPRDPERHLLLLQGGPSDVAALLKRFGALLGRPTSCSLEGFNLSLVLHRMKPSSRAKLEAWLKQVSPPPRSTAPEPTPPALEIPELKTAPAPSAPEPVSPPAASPPPPAPEPTPSTPEIPELKTAPAPSEPEPVAAPVSPPAASPPPPAPAAASVPPSVSVTALPLFIPLRGEWTFETLLVGAYNRFAHAAAMSVVSAPGSMYNPLFLHGVPGTGKSHLLGAVGAALSKGLGDAVILHTSGARLSRAVNAAALAKTMREIDTKVADSKALLVDDIHLLGISDSNKEALAKIFKSFFDRRLQVVITSLYPPKALGALEEALKFSFSKGWSVDLKVPSPAVQKELIGAISDRAGAGFAREDIALLHEKLSVWGYQDLSLWLRRVVIFKKKREADHQPTSLAQLLPLIYEPLLGGATEAPKEAPAVKFVAPALGGSAEPLAVIVPKGKEGAGSFAASFFYEVGRKHGFSQAYRHALWETYDPNQSFGIPFLIAEMCRRAGVTRAIVVGPPPDSPLGPRSAEFSHATRRILESLVVRLGWIPYNGLQVPAHFINAHLDFAPDPS